MFDRILMMGVSPVTLDDLSSGFNIGWNISTKQQFNTMLGFSETDVREMFQYYKECGKLQGDVEEMMNEIKPWYDNYCFSEESLKRDPKMFNCDMVLYYLRERIDTGHSPKQMIDPNTRTDYNKMKKLLDLDHLDGDRKGVIRRIAEEGRIVADLAPSFPAKDLVRAELFPSLLFYYGMLTIVGTRGMQLVLGIPNNNVRKQYYDYMLELYQEKRRIDLDDLINSFYAMAFDGDWRPSLEKIARDYRENSSVRSLIEGERNIQGFFQAYLSLNGYYLSAPVPDARPATLSRSGAQLHPGAEIPAGQRLRNQRRSPVAGRRGTDTPLCRRPQGTVDVPGNGAPLHRDAVLRLGTGKGGRGLTIPPIPAFLFTCPVVELHKRCIFVSSYYESNLMSHDNRPIASPCQHRSGRRIQ